MGLAPNQLVDVPANEHVVRCLSQFFNAPRDGVGCLIDRPTFSGGSPAPGAFRSKPACPPVFLSAGDFLL
jgi:hypothetical protein